MSVSLQQDEPPTVAASASNGGGEAEGTPSVIRRRWSGWIVPALVVALIVGLGMFVVEPVRVGSASMSPTLGVEQRVLIDKATYRFRSPHVGEIVAFNAPDSGILTVKRVVGVGGDKVAIRDGVLYVDGAAVHESYVDHSRVDSVYFGPVFVPQGTVFLMGDNRGESIDSRSFGPVSLSDVVGRVIPLWSP